MLAENVSIAKLVITQEEDVKIADITRLGASLDTLEGFGHELSRIADLTRLKASLDNFDAFGSSLQQKFSQPIGENEIDYLPTQYLSEQIKNLGYDGIRFSSSLDKDGYNVVLFDPTLCEVLSSEVYTVKEISYSAEKHLPWKGLEELMTDHS